MYPTTGFAFVVPGPSGTAPTPPPHSPSNAADEQQQGALKRKRADDDDDEEQLRPVDAAATAFWWSSMCRVYPRACNQAGDPPHQVQGPWGFYHAPCGTEGEVFADSLIIAVDGACPGNGTDRATKSSGGVFLGDLEGHATKWRNIAFRLPDHPEYPHTNQRAELAAAWVGVSCGMRFASEGGQWDPTSEQTRRAKHIVIKSDSAYFVESITQHLPRWRTNGWRTSSGAPVANKPIWQLLAGCMDEFDRMGVGIHFWLVPREANAEADRLARLGIKATLVLGRDNLLPPANKVR
ncbi:ribonuclease H-like protein [Apiospora rasikravindrae]|uniref:Ribonuclease H-like protein n=1 Tax=Apiospora rasikravindrae TaxID=990691 RepID=A0ABR1RXU6_9PEZI